MDMLKKLKDSVTNVLPVGNPVSAEYDILNQRASAGPGLLWKVYDAQNKSTKQEASVFICEKKSLDRLSKADRDRILDTLKRGVSQLTKLRHPNLLSVLHPLEESRDSIAFATEPVFASLANTLGRHDNMPVPVPEFIKQFELFDVEIKYGLFQLAEGLAFLHNSVKLVHGNVCAESVILNKSGAWKIAGFDFCIRNANSTEQATYYPCPEWDLDCPPMAQQNLDFLAPEYIVSTSCDTASDMFSVGVLFYAIYNKGKTLFECRNELSVFRRNVSELKKMNLAAVLGGVPADVRDYVKLLLNAEPSVRPDADQLSKLSFFEDMGSMTLQYMDSLFQRDNLQKSQFFKGLPKVIEKLPKRVNIFRVLPPLYKECANKDMVPFILPSVMLVADQCSQEEYIKHVWPGLKPLLKLKDPVQILLVLLQNMSLLLSKTPAGEIKLYVLPMVYDAVEANNPQVQELCLSILPSFANLIDYPAMKNSLIPRIKRLCLGTALLNVRVNCLVCIGKLLEYMDKWYVLDEIIPILQAIPSREPAVLMSMLGIYQVAMTHKKLGITKDILATKVLPHLFPLVIDNNLNLQQFSAYMVVIRDMIQRVESEQRGKLEQLHSIQNEHKTIPLGGELKRDTVTVSNGAASSDTMMDKIMTGFGMMSSYFGNETTAAMPSSAEVKNSSQSSSTSSLNSSISSVPTPSPADTKLPNQPAKVQLTLEEKQKLAKQQEIQQQFKTQTNLTAAPTPLNPSSTPKFSSTPARDLTHTLLDTEVRTNKASPLLASQDPFSSPSVSSSAGWGSGSNTGGGQAKSPYQSLGPVLATSNVNRGSPTFNNSPRGPSTGASGMGPQVTNNLNKSSLDSFLSPSNTQQPKSTMVHKPPAVSNMAGGSAMQPMNMAGNIQMSKTGMMGNMQMNPTGMAGSTPMGQQSMMGTMNMNQQRMQMNQQGMMGGLQMNQPSMGNMQMGQPRIGNMTMSPQNTMGNMQMNQQGGMGNRPMGPAFGGANVMGGMGTGMMQPTRMQNPMMGNQQNTKSLSSKDIADFLG